MQYMTTPLLSCQSLSKSFGPRILFQDLSLSIFSEDRLGLIGPNGSGKTTLLKILAGQEKSDSGIISGRRGLRIGYVPQTCEFPDLEPKVILLDALRSDLEKADYEKEHLAEIWLSKFGFTGQERSAARLSGGWKKRLSLAQQLISSPDLLFLDEPTNHLDLEGILWLEKFLLREVRGYLLVSHDRYFLQNVTNRIIEINPAFPKGMFAIDGSYHNFLEKKEDFLKGQLQHERSLASKARREVEWMRSNPKARTSKSKARGDEAEELLQELSQVERRNLKKRVGIDFTASESETRKLLVAKNLSMEIEGRLLFRNLDFTLSPGTRIGLMGPNGSGKTTLLRLIAGEISPTQGTIKRADSLQIVYFDQHKTKLPNDITLRQALSPNGDFIQYHGQSIHINGWCKRFLFSPDMLDLSIGRFSGGERARIAIAHLMLQPANLLLLDEPTNDLDIPTLEALEETLLEFPGAIVLITHDRCMLDRTCNGLLALGDPNKTQIYADYAQWQASLKTVTIEAPAKERKTTAAPPKIKLTYAERKEYEQIEGKILKLEEEVKDLNQLLDRAEIAQDPLRLTEVCTAISLVETQIEQLYLRWDELSKKT
ncbi:MAG TPA: ABC-F family ATP-binding cassette domain-containing protein [Rhabdochlamydiaceae bacterium]|nr:ABC-F family ATP-binding cassette domain-containing protein [Rhabdochlamydiaceae bacterium]